MNKFKFDDKVWHELYGHGVYGKSFNLKTTELSQVMFESVGCINVLTSELTLATDWVKCSERMPELLPADADYCPASKDIFFETYYGSIFHGSYIQREVDADIETDEDIASENITHEYFFNTHDGDDLFEEESVTRWMYVPAPPTEDTQ